MTQTFDYNTYHRKVEATVKRTGGLKGVLAREYIPVTQWTLGDFCVECRDRERLLKLELEGIARTLAVDTDWIPYLEPWHGVGVYAEAFGCPFEWRDGDSPWTHPIVHTIDDLNKLGPVSFDRAKMLNFVCESVAYFDKETGGELPIALTDTQSPLDNATLVCDTTFFFLACYEHPEPIKQLIQWITELMIESGRQQQALARNQAKPGHIMWSAPDGKGMSVSEDNLVMCGADYYREFAEPYNLQLAEAFGGLAVHSCGSWKQHFPALKATPGIFMVDLAAHRSLDPNPNDIQDVLKGFAGGDTLVQIRANYENDDPETSFSWIDQLRGPGFPMIIQLPFPNDPKIANRNYAILRKKLDGLMKRDWQKS